MGPVLLAVGAPGAAQGVELGKREEVRGEEGLVRLGWGAEAEGRGAWMRAAGDGCEDRRRRAAVGGGRAMAQGLFNAATRPVRGLISAQAGAGAQGGCAAVGSSRGEGGG